MPGGPNFEKGAYYLRVEARLVVLVAGMRLSEVHRKTVELPLNFGKANVEFHLSSLYFVCSLCRKRFVSPVVVCVFLCVWITIPRYFFVKFTELSGTFLHCICSKSLLYFSNSYKTNSFAYSALLKTSISSSCNKSVKIKLPDLVQFVETTCSKPVDHKF